MSAWRKQANADAYVDGIRAAIPLIAAQIDLLHRLIDATVVEVDRMLDLGCGDGALAATVLDRRETTIATLVDFSEPMLARARERFSGQDERVAFVHADLAEPGWIEHVETGAPYDLVISGYAIHHLENDRKRALFRAVYELLKPGGLFVNLEHVASSSALGRELFDELFIDSLFAQAAAADATARREDVAARYHGREDEADNVLVPVDEQCRWLRDIGFVDVDCYFRMLELALYAGRRP